MESEKIIAGYDGECPVCGSKDCTIIRSADGRFRNMCRFLNCPAYYHPAPAVGFDNADDCRQPFDSEYLKPGTVSVGEYIFGKREKEET